MNKQEAISKLTAISNILAYRNLGEKSHILNEIIHWLIDTDIVEPEPSDEPPSPEQIGPGEQVPLIGGSTARIWYTHNSYIGIVEEEIPSQFAWTVEGKAFSPSYYWIDWREWRRRREQS